MMEKRTIVRAIRFTPSEIELFDSLAERHDMKGSTDFIRSALLIALGLPSQVERFGFGFDEARKQLRGAASNLNQLTRRANSGDIKGWTAKEQKRVDDIAAAVAGLHKVIASYNKIAQQRQLVDPAQYRAEYEQLMADVAEGLG